MSGKRALITGIRGQDGAYLASLLLEKGYEVHGADRRSGSDPWRLRELGIEDQVKIHYMDLLELTNIIAVLDRIQPDEIYNLAAQSDVAVSFQQPLVTLEVNAMGVLRLLEAVYLVCKGARVYQASSSEMYGCSFDLDRPFLSPVSPYGVSKVMAHHLVSIYRQKGLWVSAGIAFNHESPLRGEKFVTRKITLSAVRMVRKKGPRLLLGNLNSIRDWGHARDYVYAMWLALQQSEPSNYILSTGESHTVREFVERAFEALNVRLTWAGKGTEERGLGPALETLVVVSTELYRPVDIDYLCMEPDGPPGWEREYSFEQLVLDMVAEDDVRVRGGLC